MPIETHQPLLDTSEMLVVHALFRREFGLAADLIRSLPPADRPRAMLTADHLALIEEVLHHHHTSEDELLWPLLLDRVPDELAPLVELMERQHAVVDRLLARLQELRPAWAADPTPSRRDELAAVYDQLYTGLTEHLDAEETRVLPLVARCITSAEWAALGEAGRNGIPRKHQALVFGMLMYRADPRVIASMLAPAPWPVRVLVPRLGRRAYARRAASVHGTRTP